MSGTVIFIVLFLPSYQLMFLPIVRKMVSGTLLKLNAVDNLLLYLGRGAVLLHMTIMLTNNSLENGSEIWGALHKYQHHVNRR